MERRWFAFGVLACWFAIACSPASESPLANSGEPTRAAAGVVAAIAGGAGARAPVVMMNPAASGSGGSAVPIKTSSAGMPAPTLPVSAGRPAAVSGGAAAPSSSAAGSAALAMRSVGCDKPNSMTGQFQGMIRAFDLDRGYYMSVPKNYDPARAYRLVFGFHGSNYTGKMMRQYLDNEKAPLLEGTIFVYPDGLPLANEPDNIAWELKANGRDIAFFDTLLAYLRESYCIDETRIFVNGQSFGALMTNFVGCMRGDLVRAIAVVAGSGPYGNMCQGKVAVWMTHGTDDMSVPFKSGEMSRDFWLKQNGCGSMTVPGMPAQCLVYQGCDPENPVTWCPHTGDGGHQHPNFGRAAVREFLASF